jgi:hypothetical protein
MFDTQGEDGLATPGVPAEGLRTALIHPLSWHPFTVGAMLSTFSLGTVKKRRDLSL